jgi:hypothetical protein
VIIFRGKASKMSFKALLHIAFFALARPVEKLEPEDFSKN